MMKRGFTLIELMVASILLGILVTALTMLFNASAIAWRTGTAGVVQMAETREKLGAIHAMRDAVLPGIGDSDAVMGKQRTLSYRTVSIWKNDFLRTDRAYDSVNSKGMGFDLSGAARGATISLPAGNTKGGSLYTVGVRSAGPDRKYGTADDITTWPDGVF